jgi:hypothetical protein
MIIIVSRKEGNMMENTLGVLEGLGFFVVVPAIIGFAVVGSTILISRVKQRARMRRQTNNQFVYSIDAD